MKNIWIDNILSICKNINYFLIRQNQLAKTHDLEPKSNQTHETKEIIIQIYSHSLKFGAEMEHRVYEELKGFL